MGWFIVFPYLIHFLVFHFASSTLSLCNPHDLSSLLLFNNSFTVNNSLDYYCPSPFPKTASWKNGRDCCEWDGVTCDTISGHVIALDLSCSMLQGHFHPNTTLFHLTHLQLLNLSSNGFYGSSIYSGIGDLVNLKHLDLSYSGFVGHIPSTISHLSKLVSLDLSSYVSRDSDRMRVDPSTWNKLILNANGLIELNLDGIDMSSIRESSISLLLNLSSSLVSLNLGDTGLQGNFPTGILCLPNLQLLGLKSNENLRGQLPKSNWSTPLRHLSIIETSFSGEIPNSIGHLRFLNELWLSSCQFDGLIPLSLWNLTQLTSLVLASNNLTGEISPLLSNLKHLTGLFLFDNNLEGQLPLSLFNLTQLTSLDLSSNNLTGDISPLLSNLKHLTMLYLSDNNLEGQLPSSLFNLTQLTSLDLSFNNLNGEISPLVSNLKHLTEFYLSDNSLEGQLISSLFNLTQLSDLALSYNKLAGPIPSKTTKLSKLSFLALGFNFLNGTIPLWCYSLPSLSQLYLNDNQLTGSISEFSTYSMIYLDLSNNKLQGNFPNSIYEFQNLSMVDLSSNDLSGLLDFHQFSWRYISHIDLSFNQLQGDITHINLRSYDIEYFSVSNNNLSGDISSAICNASSLVILILSHNNLSGVIPQCLGNFPTLSVLDLQRNNLHGEIPRNFCEGNALETIKLNGNRLEGPLPQSLANCKNLEVLDLGDNNIEDIFPSWLETLQELQVLSLRLNKFHSTFTCSSTKHPFPKLRIFDVSNNCFSGPLPTSCISNFQGMMEVNDSQTSLKYMTINKVNNTRYGELFYNDSVVVIWKGESVELVRVLTSFTTIDLSNNMFEGEIPKVIGELNFLIGLNLSHNRINGTIPQSLSNLKSLEWLDLSWNKLKGEIPMTLTNLNFLSFLNLSENQLERMIPTGGQFNTFENVSYEGNLLLCGFPLSESCNKDEGQPKQSTLRHEDSLFGWKVVVVGYASGVVFGVLLGYSVFFTRKPQWLARLVGAMPNKRVRRTNNRAHANRRGMN